MHPGDRVFMRRLLVKVSESERQRIEQLSTGCASDYADYSKRCGFLQALNDVRIWCQEIAETDDENPPRPK